MNLTPQHPDDEKFLNQEKKIKQQAIEFCSNETLACYGETVILKMQ